MGTFCSVMNYLFRYFSFTGEEVLHRKNLESGEQNVGAIKIWPN
jgi:hypothetical protein